MPVLTNIELALLNDLEKQANELEKAELADVARKTSEVVAKTAKVVVAMVKTGGVSQEDCRKTQADILGAIDTAIESKFNELNKKIGESDWKAKAAMWVPLSLAFLGLGLKTLSLHVK